MGRLRKVVVRLCNIPRRAVPLLLAALFAILETAFYDRCVFLQTVVANGRADCAGQRRGWRSV